MKKHKKGHPLDRIDLFSFASNQCFSAGPLGSTAVAKMINTLTPTETIAPVIKSNFAPSVIELTTYETICTKRNDQKKVQKYRTIFHL